MLNVEQDISQIINQLPLLPQDLPCFVIRRQNHQTPSNYKDFIVNRKNIIIWLRFLHQNNRYYHDIDIDVAIRRAQDILPENGSIANQLRSSIEEEDVDVIKNVWQIAGLCNGATGIVKEIIYDDNNPAPGLCSCVIVDFGDTYVGEPFFDDDDSKKEWVPIFPTTAEWETVEGDSRKTHARTMIPLRLSYAWTIWKSQYLIPVYFV